MAPSIEKTTCKTCQKQHLEICKKKACQHCLKTHIGSCTFAKYLENKNFECGCDSNLNLHSYENYCCICKWAVIRDGG